MDYVDRTGVRFSVCGYWPSTRLHVSYNVVGDKRGVELVIGTQWE